METSQLWLVVSILGLGGLAFIWIKGRHRSTSRRSADPTAIIQALPYFQNLGPEHLRRLMDIMAVREFVPGEWIINEDTRGQALWVVLSGTVHIMKRGTFDHTLVSSVAAGEVVGELALVTGNRRMASAQAVEHAQALEIPAAAFQRLMERVPAFADAVWTSCERHVLQQIISDHEALRSMPLVEQEAWMQSRQVVVGGPGAAIRVPSGCDRMALIVGRVQIGSRVWTAPALVAVQPTAKLTFSEPSRCAFLVDPVDGRSGKTSGLASVS